AARARHPGGRRPEVLREEPPQLAGADAEPIGESVDAAVVQRAGGDQAKRARDDGRGAGPCGRAGSRFGTAAATGPEAGGLGRGRAREPADVLRLRRPDGADGAAVDAGRDHAGEEAAVEATVAAEHGLVAVCGIEDHDDRLASSNPGLDMGSHSLKRSRNLSASDRVCSMGSKATKFRRRRLATDGRDRPLTGDSRSYNAAEQET